jgi:hypothetical protein
MNVFLSYAVGPTDGPIPARLRAVAAAYDISILLPDRTHISPDRVTADTLTKIQASDAVIALVSRTANVGLVNLVNLELQAAAQANKPIIALMEEGVPFQGAAKTHLVYFDRFNPTAHESSLMTALEEIRRQKWKQDLTSLGWIAGIALGLIALSQLFSDDK